MNFKSKMLVLFLILAVRLSVSVVSASEVNETLQAGIDDSQEKLSLEVNEDEVLESNSNDDVVLEAVNENVSDPVLSVVVVSNDVNATGPVSPEKSVSTSVAASSEPVLKSSYGKIKKVTLKSKYNKYVTKKVGKYKVQVYKWKGYSLGGLEIYVLKYGKYVKSSKFVSRAYFKSGGKWRWSSWSHASRGYLMYHHYPVSSSVKISKVQVKFRYY